jgi:PhzF family phenazine biosynthesis protein
VVRDLHTAGDAVTLEMIAGLIPVRALGDVWTLQANAPRHRPVSATREQMAAMLGLAPDDLADEASPPLWIDTGSEQLVVPLASADAVRRAAPRADLMQAYASTGQRSMAYVWARENIASPVQGTRPVVARFFFPKHGAIIEDPGTGSACANLGGWLIVTGASLPQRMAISQGDQVGRACRLGLEVGDDRSIRVSGRVIALGSGTVTL